MVTMAAVWRTEEGRMLTPTLMCVCGGGTSYTSKPFSDISGVAYSSTQF